MWGKCGEMKYICNMSTIKYFIKGNKELSQIYIRIRDGRKIDLSTKTGLVIDSVNWSIKKGEVKQTSTFSEKRNLQSRLDKLGRILNEQIHIAKINDFELNREWLNNCIEIFHGKVKNDSTEFIRLINNHVLGLQNRLKKVESQTTKGFGTTILHLTKYQNHIRKVIHISDITNQFLDLLVTFLKDVERYSPSTINKDISRIFQVCKSARLNGIEVNESIFLKKYHVTKSKRLIATLNQSELNIIKQFTGTDFLENARDWLIIGCWTGCRISDLMNLNSNNIITKPDGKKIIKYFQTKTKKDVELSIHPDVESIIKRLNGFPRPIRPQNFNDYIKKLCERVGFIEEMKGEKMNPKTKRKETGTFMKYELVTSHICRRSFATNHYSLLTNKKIMRVTGHATERQFLEYIGEIDDDHLEAFENLYNSTEK
jgi:integrase